MKHLSQLLREIISVIIGILVALFINNWNEDRKDTLYLNQIFSSIEKELEESLKDIERVIPLQMESIDSLQKYMNNEEFTLYDIVIKSNGVHTPRIKTNSWNAIANSKIELVAYDKLSVFADIEERKENLKWRLEKQTEFMFKNMEETDKAKKEMLLMTIKDMVGAEKRLQSQIEELLKDETVFKK